MSNAVDEAVASGLSDTIDDPEPEPKVIDVDVTSERDDDSGIASDALPTALPVRVEPSEAGLVPLRDELKGLTEMAVTLAIADNVPKALRGKPAAILAVLLTGRELDIPPMTALRNLHVIDGQVTVNPKIRAAMVRRQGLGKLWPHQGPREIPCPGVGADDHADDCPLCAGTGKVTKLCECGRSDPDNDGEVCTWHAKRNDDPWVIYSSTYTLAMARAVVNYVKDGKTHYLADKDNWKNYPDRMLSWRSLGYLLDDAFPEVGTGLYTPDELGAVTDEDGIPVIDVDSTEALTESAQRARRDAKNEPPPPPASPDTIAEFKRRIDEIKKYEGAPNALLGLWNGYRGEGKDQAEPLPKVEDLLYRHCPTATGLIAQVERRIQKGEFKQVESDAVIVDDEEDGPPGVAPDGPDTPPDDPETGSEVERGEHDDIPEIDEETVSDVGDDHEPDLFGQSDQEEVPEPESRIREFEIDVDQLPSGKSPAEDLIWVEAIRESNPVKASAWIEEIASAVQSEPVDALTGIMKLLDLSANGLNEATKRARIAARRIRMRVEKDAGL